MDQSKVSCAPDSVFQAMQEFALRAETVRLALSALVFPLEEKGELHGEAHLVELLAGELDELNADLADYGTHVRVAMNDQQR